MKILKYVLALGALLFFLGCEDNAAQTVIEDNKSFKELKAKVNKTYTLSTMKGQTIVFDLDNNRLISSQLNGKPVLINFWATWCPPCKEEIPAFNKLYEKYSDKFEIIAVLFEKNKDRKELEAFVNEYKMAFPVTVGEAENFRLAENLGNITKIPESFLYGADGSFIKRYVGVVDEAELEAHIK